ncbi:hypothetical protein MPHL43072_24300 [Mycolicibacterium phlei DSM 43072]|nr:hypothetical protein MPHL43070_20745 [Mycolicibacterium phlei DSM 43070]KXW66860.1 hypothetical protein MPHL43072_24300 [Mycolicibacterium phlei DSM 43072]
MSTASTPVRILGATDQHAIERRAAMFAPFLSGEIRPRPCEVVAAVSV